jgi:hypothetical protein
MFSEEKKICASNVSMVSGPKRGLPFTPALLRACSAAVAERNASPYNNLIPQLLVMVHMPESLGEISASMFSLLFSCIPAINFKFSKRLYSACV